MTENVENIRELIHKDITKQSMSSSWGQLWSLRGDHNRKFENVLHWCEIFSPTLDILSGFVIVEKAVVMLYTFPRRLF
jgi:hypothetical protein